VAKLRDGCALRYDPKYIRVQGYGGGEETQKARGMWFFPCLEIGGAEGAWRQQNPPVIHTRKKAPVLEKNPIKHPENRR